MQSALDAAEQKLVFDAQLSKANADASQMKAAFDKVCAHACVCGGGGCAVSHDFVVRNMKDPWGSMLRHFEAAEGSVCADIAVP